MRSVEKQPSLAKGQSEQEKSLEEGAFTVPRMLRLFALGLVLVTILICFSLLILDFVCTTRSDWWDFVCTTDTAWHGDPTKAQLIGFLFVLVIAAGICSLDLSETQR